MTSSSEASTAFLSQQFGRGIRAHAVGPAERKLPSETSGSLVYCPSTRKISEVFEPSRCSLCNCRATLSNFPEAPSRLARDVPAATADASYSSIDPSTSLKPCV